MLEYICLVLSVYGQAFRAGRLENSGNEEVEGIKNLRKKRVDAP